MSAMMDAPSRFTYVKSIVRDTRVLIPAPASMRARVLDEYLAAHGLDLPADARADRVRAAHGR